MGFHFSSLKDIQDRFDEVVNRELEKHGANKNYDKLPLHRRKQINFISNILKDLQLNGLEEFSELEIKKIATGVVRLQKIMILNVEYGGYVSKLLGSADNSLMFRENNYIIGVDEHNKIDLYERECLQALRNYLLIKNNLHKTVDPNVLTVKEVLDFIQTRIPTPSVNEIRKVINSLKHTPNERAPTMQDVLRELRFFNREHLKKTIAFDFKTKHLHAIDNFNKQSLNHVETLEKQAPLRLKYFKSGFANMTEKERLAFEEAKKNGEMSSPTTLLHKK